MYKRLIAFCGSVVIVGLIIILVIVLAPKPPIPGSIKKQVTATIIIPKGGEGTIDRDKVTYDAKLKLLVYPIQIYGTRVVVSEQPTPDSFIDIPQVFEKVVDSSNEYLKFDAAIGTVHLTRPKDLGGKQAVIMNSKGTLMFAKPDKDLSEDQWRKLFNTMDVLR